MGKQRKQNGETAKKTPEPSKQTLLSNIGIICASCVIAIGIVIFKYNQNVIPKEAKDVFSKSYSPSKTQLENGGWRKPDDVTFEKYWSGFCNIDRLFNYELTDELFEKKYRYKRPLIIMFDKGAIQWTDIERWTVSQLKKDYGEWEVLSGNAREIVRRGGSGYVKSSFSEYVDKLMQSKDEVDEPLYVFDRSFYNDSELPSTLRPPSFLQIRNGIDDSIFFLGTSGSGVSFHHHADAWNGVIFGKKRWFLYPRNKTPPGGVYPGLTQLQWHSKLYPYLEEEDKPEECVQDTGEIMYLPEGMYHSTINIGDTIAVGIQKKQATTETEKLFYEENELAKKQARIKDVKEKVKLTEKRKAIYNKLAKQMPENTEIQMKLGGLYKDLEDYVNANIHTLTALDKDPNFIVAMLNLADINAKLSKPTEAEQVYRHAHQLNPKLWDFYAKFGDFLLNQNRPKEAVEIYKKGVELEPQQPAFWHQLLLAQTRAGDEEGAKKTKVEIDRRKRRG